jgi:hypothetical protein
MDQRRRQNTVARIQKKPLITETRNLPAVNLAGEESTKEEGVI